MNLVILDGHTVNPGDLAWDAFHDLGHCVIHDRTAPGEVVTRAAEAEIVLTNKTVLSAEIINRLPKLRYLGVLATGYNVVDVAAARARGVTVANIPGYSTRSVAQHALALILELTNHVGHYAPQVTQGEWSRARDFCYWDPDQPLLELDGLTLGIVGYGAIGQCLAESARALGMKIIAGTRRPREAAPGVTFLSIDELLKQCDIVSLHCPLTDETRSLINARTLALMKPAALLINTARGPLIDEPALATALHENRIAGAGLDVLSAEPPPADHPLLTAPRCLVTPHQSWASRAARTRLIDIAAANVRAFLAGKPVNIVN
jgi:glycerate dehydrogenase